MRFKNNLFKINFTRFFSNEAVKPEPPKKTKKLAKQFNDYFNSAKHLQEIRQFVPEKHIMQKTSIPPDNVYLVDSEIAKVIASYVLPVVEKNRRQVVCESSAGLGLISSELLDQGVPVVRLYEQCPDFRSALKDFNVTYPGRIELFTKNFFHLYKLSFMDKIDQGSRVDEMLRGVSRRDWTDEPVMTVIGATSSSKFIKYLMRTAALQTEIYNYGRIQLFLIMKPMDYINLSAGPHLNYQTYKGKSIIFNLFFDHKLLDKFPRRAFFPWEKLREINPYTSYGNRIDRDQVYLVQINFKKNLPERADELYYFIKHGFGKGKRRIIPTIEGWLPGCGLDLIASSSRNIGIFTLFNELTPEELLQVFEQMTRHEGYDSCPFNALVQSELMKSETVESDLAAND